MRLLDSLRVGRHVRVWFRRARTVWHVLRDYGVRFSGRPRLHVVNLERQMICCTMRDDDLLRMRRYFSLNGYVEVSDPKLADVVLLNTCAFDKGREETAIALVKEFSRYRGDLLVTGCVGKINEQALRAVFGGPCVAPPDLDSDLDAFLATKGALRVPFSDVVRHGGEKRLYDGGLGWRRVTRPRRKPKSATVKVVNGCPQQCAYCTHRLSIGFEPVSVPLERILSAVEGLVSEGAEVIQLLGDNLGPYGVDIKSSVPDLLAKLGEACPGVRFALDQYHAAYFIRDYRRGLRSLIAKGLVYELKMPIQSGSARVLEAMNRRTDLRKLAEFVKEAAGLAPDMLFVTHMITGFPTETEDEFQESVHYVREVFAHNSLVYIFPCSVHPDTPAAALEPRVPYEKALERAVAAERALRAAGIDVCLDQLDVMKERGECGYVATNR